MWIRTQNKKRIINSDQIIDIFISANGTSICARVNTSENGEVIHIGEYEDRETCLKVLDDLFHTCFPDGCTYRMPLGGEV